MRAPLMIWEIVLLGIACEVNFDHCTNILHLEGGILWYLFSSCAFNIFKVFRCHEVISC